MKCLGKECFSICKRITKDFSIIIAFKFLLLSRGEICEANFIPPTNGARLGSYFVKNYCFEASCDWIGLTKTALAAKRANVFLKWFFGVSVHDIQTDIVINSLTPYLHRCEKFLFQLHLLSPYSLLSYGNKLCSQHHLRVNKTGQTLLINYVMKQGKGRGKHLW